MTFPITNPETRAHLVELSRAIDAARDADAVATDHLAEATQRAHALRRTIADHKAAEPAADPALAADLSAMLAANPGAATSADWAAKLGEAQDAHETALTAWRGKRTILDGALARVEVEVAERTTASEAADNAVSSASATFRAEAREAVMGEMQARWAEFAANTLDIAAALERFGRFRDAGQLTFCDNGVTLIGGNRAVVSWLYKVGEMTDHGAYTAIERFRSSLVEPDAAPARAPAPRRAPRG